MAEILPEVETFARIKVIGVGGGGGAAIERMIKSIPMPRHCIFRMPPSNYILGMKLPVVWVPVRTLRLAVRPLRRVKKTYMK
jgi:hypothetical protein